MYIISTEKVIKLYCHKDYNYYHMNTGTYKTVSKGTFITVAYTKYESDNMDKVVTYDYIMKSDNHHIALKEFHDFFMTLNKRRQELLKNILK